MIIIMVVVLSTLSSAFFEKQAGEGNRGITGNCAATSKVIRDGHQMIIHSEDLVPGDIIVLEAGDAVPADARLLECASLKIEEAALTGESVQ